MDDRNHIVKFLVVDDNQAAADSLVRLIDALGWSAAGVYSADECLRYLTDTKADIILLDIDMPETDGYALVRTLRQDMQLTLPIIALTGYGSEKDKEKMLAAGFTARLTKPIGTKELRELVADFEAGKW